MITADAVDNLARALIVERYTPPPTARRHPDDTPEAQAARRAILARATTRNPAAGDRSHDSGRHAGHTR